MPSYRAQMLIRPKKRVRKEIVATITNLKELLNRNTGILYVEKFDLTCVYMSRYVEYWNCAAQPMMLRFTYWNRQRTHTKINFLSKITSDGTVTSVKWKANEKKTWNEKIKIFLLQNKVSPRSIWLQCQRVTSHPLPFQYRKTLFVHTARRDDIERGQEDSQKKMYTYTHRGGKDANKRKQDQ